MDKEKQEQNQKENRSNGGGYFWAFLLIALGIIFLLNNLEILPWSIWGSLWRLWPVFLIVGGIQIIFGRSKLLSFIISFICFCLIVFALILGFTDLIKPSAGSFLAGLKEKFHTFLMTSGNEISDNLIITDNQYQGIAKRVIKVELDSSTFTINSADTNNYLELLSRYYENIGTPVVTKNAVNGSLNIYFKTESKSWDFFNPGLNRRYDFTLGKKELDTELDLNLVSGKSETVLNGMYVSKIDAKQVSGSGIIDISNPLNSHSKINVEMTSGSMVVNMPTYTSLFINYEVVSGSLKVEDQIYTGKGAFSIENSINSFEGSESPFYDAELNIKVVSGGMTVNLEN